MNARTVEVVSTARRDGSWTVRSGKRGFWGRWVYVPHSRKGRQLERHLVTLATHLTCALSEALDGTAVAHGEIRVSLRCEEPVVPAGRLQITGDLSLESFIEVPRIRAICRQLFQHDALLVMLNSTYGAPELEFSVSNRITMPIP